MEDRPRGCGCPNCVRFWSSPRGLATAAKIDRLAAGFWAERDKPPATVPATPRT